MVSEFIQEVMDNNTTRESGLMTSTTEWALRPGLMEVSIKDNMNMERNKEKEYIFGQMEISTLEYGMTIK